MKVRYVKGQNKVPIKMWADHVTIADNALEQADTISNLPFIFKHVALMPDAHLGYGSTVGSVIPTKGAIIPAAVGVDIGCGMMAYQTSLKFQDMPKNLHDIRVAIEEAVPHGRSDNGGPNDVGSWSPSGGPSKSIVNVWNTELSKVYERIANKHPVIASAKTVAQLGTLGGGNHFIELCTDEYGDVWIMLHSGSRGVGNVIGRYFTELARADMERFFIHLPNKDLAYLPEGTRHFEDYIEAMRWAQKFATENRELMMGSVIMALYGAGVPPFRITDHAINCHHNYTTLEHHYNENIWITRKGAVCARKGVMGIIPGSMGAKSYIVRGLGNPESFHSCSHGAGRAMSRTEANHKFTVDDLEFATRGIECPKTQGVVAEIPQAYKPIEDVMASQSDLVEIVYELKQFLNVKGED